jgi:hypothetical protein
MVGVYGSRAQPSGIGSMSRSPLSHEALSPSRAREPRDDLEAAGVDLLQARLEAVALEEA